MSKLIGILIAAVYVTAWFFVINWISVTFSVNIHPIFPLILIGVSAMIAFAQGEMLWNWLKKKVGKPSEPIKRLNDVS